MSQSDREEALRAAGVGEAFYAPVNLLDLASHPEALLPHARIFHAHSMAPVRIELSDLPIGSHFLDLWPIVQRPAGAFWQRSFYNSMAPATFILRDVGLHSAAGILTIGDKVLADTLAHTDPSLHFYTATQAGITLQGGRQPAALSGRYISLLAGAGSNYYHAMMEGVVRLSMIPLALIEAADGVLFSADAPGAASALERCELPASLRRIAVSNATSLQVEELVFPWTVHGEFDYHPCVADFFAAVSRNVADPFSASQGEHSLPRRIYIDRRYSPMRPMVNEAALIATLAPLGFVPVRLERLDFADQVRLFRQAEAIVAPHGAGLVNIGYCEPGAFILELFSADFVVWCYRPLAAVMRLRYDCVVGPALADAGAQGGSANGAWHISVDHVAAAVRFHLG